MLFHLCIVFLLPYLLQVSSQSEEARDIVENARGLFNAVAKNESEMVGKFVSALRKNEEKLETAYDNLKKAMESSVRKHRHQPNFIQRNRAIKRGADSGLPINYEAEFEKIRGQMEMGKKIECEDQVKYLLRLLVDERAEKKAEQKRANDAEKDKSEKEILLKKFAVLYFFRHQLDRLQWALQQDREVQEVYMGTAEDAEGEVTKKNHKRVQTSKKLEAIKNEWVTVPESVPDDGRKSYIKRFQIWHAIFIVMGRKPNVLIKTNRKQKTRAKNLKEHDFTTKDYDFVFEIKEIFHDVGFNTDEGTEESNASKVALFFNKVSGWAKSDVTTNVDFKDENDVIAALKNWKVSSADEDIGRVIYRANFD